MLIFAMPLYHWGIFRNVYCTFSCEMNNNISPKALLSNIPFNGSCSAHTCILSFSTYKSTALIRSPFSSFRRAKLM